MDPNEVIVSEPILDETTVAELPRLRIHHFFVFTTVFAVVMSVWLGIWRLIRTAYPDAAIPEFGTGMSLLFSVQTLSPSTCIGIALLGLAWRKWGISFPSQPGHWMAIYLAITWVYEIALFLASLFLHSPTLNLGVMAWVTMPMSLAFHCFALALWVAAYLHEPDRIWKLGWVAMSLKSLFIVCWTLFLMGKEGVERLLDLFQFNSQFDWDFFFLLGPWERIIAKGFLAMLSTYPLILFLPAAAILDLRQHRQRHWSHWLVVISTFVSTAILTVNYQIAL